MGYESKGSNGTKRDISYLFKQHCTITIDQGYRKKRKGKMSAAAARRRKQLLQKKLSQEEQNSVGDDPVFLRLNSLLHSDDSVEIDGEVAYEALQLAQSQVRRLVKAGDVGKAVELCYLSLTTLLKKKKVSVASQLLMLFSDVIVETKTKCSEELVLGCLNIDKLYREALGQAFEGTEEKEEEERLSRVHYKFLRRIVRWSAEYGMVQYGDMRLHTALAMHCWSMVQNYKESLEKMKDEEFDDVTVLQEITAEAMIHLALAEDTQQIINILKTLPPPTDKQDAMGRNGGTASERDCLFTRAILVFIAVQNLRDANLLLKSYRSLTNADMPSLAKSYINKNDGKAPTHIMFCSMLLQICEKDRAGPLFQWILRSFSHDLNLMKPDVKAYTTKIGRVFFNIQPPPSMFNMMENMMGMMGGGAAMNMN